MPDYFLKELPWKTRYREVLRKVANEFAFLNPFIRLEYKNASIIFCTTKETVSIFPKRFRNKIAIEQAIGTKNLEQNVEYNNNCNLLYVGRLEDWKGVHIILKIFEDYIIEYSDEVKLTILGSHGNYSKVIENLIGGIPKENVNWINKWIEDYSEVLEEYSNSGIFIFLSLHEAGGMVVLEAMMRGLPVICFDLGGPGQIVNENCGRVIKTEGRSKSEVENSLKVAVHELVNDPELRKKLSDGAIKMAAEFTWNNSVKRVYKKIELVLKEYGD